MPEEFFFFYTSITHTHLLGMRPWSEDLGLEGGQMPEEW